MNVLYCNKEVYPQIDDPFRCINIYNRKAFVALWVHPCMCNIQYELYLEKMFFGHTGQCNSYLQYLLTLGGRSSDFRSWR